MTNHRAYRVYLGMTGCLVRYLQHFGGGRQPRPERPVPQTAGGPLEPSCRDRARPDSAESALRSERNRLRAGGQLRSGICGVSGEVRCRFALLSALQRLAYPAYSGGAARDDLLHLESVQCARPDRGRAVRRTYRHTLLPARGTGNGRCPAQPDLADLCASGAQVSRVSSKQDRQARYSPTRKLAGSY